MSRKKQSDPLVITLENHLDPRWTHTVHLSEADARLLASGRIPDWLERVAQFWERDHPKPSDVPTLEVADAQS